MVGDGEGMVAIIEGLQDSAIAITLVNNRRYNRQERLKQKPRAYGMRRLYEVPKTKSSVETSTQYFDRVNKSAQICDGRYASSYQLAHCNKVPTSPAVDVPEFPPQRAEPCRTQGNFEVGGYENCESNHSPGTVLPINSFRNRCMLSDRGSSSVHASHSTRLDAFAHSLRRYPCLSPDRTVSTEFIQKLITYTQTKNHSKNSRQSKSMRSLLHERSQEMKSNRNIKTNMRTKHETPTKDDNQKNISHVNRNSLHVKSKNNSSDLGKDKNTRYNDSILNETYDYLKTNIPRRYPKSSDVRYMRTLSKYVRETLKQIYNIKPMGKLQVCPQVKRRYDRHMKQHHSGSIQQLQPCTCLDDQDSVVNVCTVPSKIRKPSGQKCFCSKPVRCEGEQGTSKLQNYQDTKESKSTSKDDLFNKNNDKSKNYSKIIDDVIYEWLREVPVYAIESPEAKTKRNEIIKQLSETLKRLNEDEFNARARDEIKKCIDSLPMWYPGDKREQDTFKEQLVDKLVIRLNRVPKKDKFTDEVSNFVNDMPLKNRDSNGRAVNKDNISDSLAVKLKAIANDRPSDDNAYKAELRAELLNTLKELLSNVDHNRKKELIQMVESLIAILMKVTPEDVHQTNNRKLSTMENPLERQILEWLSDCPELPNGSISDTKEMIKKLEKILQKYKGNDLNDINIQNQIQADINDWLDNAIKNKGRLDSTVKENVTRRLLHKLISSDAFKYFKSLNINSDLNQSISDWIENIPDLSNRSKNEQKKLIQSLAAKLLGLDDDNDIRREIYDWLSETLDTESDHLNIKDIDDLVEELIHEIKNVSRVTDSKVITKNRLDNKKNTKNNQELNFRKRWSADLPNSVHKEISQIIDQEHAEFCNYKKQDLKDKIANVLSKNISNKPRPNKAGSKSLPEKMRAQSKSFASRTMLLKNNLRKEVNDILKKFHIRPEYIDEIANSLLSDLENGIGNGTVSNIAEDEIYDILLDAGIPEDQAVSVNNQLLKKANEIASATRQSNAPARIAKVSKLERNRTPIKPSIDIETEAFKYIAEKETIDLLGEVTGEDSVDLRNKRKGAICELLCKIGDIIYDIDLLEEDKVKEVIKCLRKISLPPEVSKEEFSSELINRIRNLTSKSSNNTSRRKDNSRMYFNPEAESTRMPFSASNIADSYQDDNRNRHKKKTSVDLEKELIDEFSDIINNWIDELPIDLNATENKSFKETMVKDLAGDIIDRLKYLQLNPDLKSTDQEELEHFKYQVFRWLNKLVSADELNPILPKTQVLMDRIKQVKIPQLVQPSGKRKESKISQGGIPNHTDALQDEILLWLEEMPPCQLKLCHSCHFKQMAKKLHDIIQQQRDNKNAYLNHEIEQCLNEVVYDKNKLNKIVESLKNRLISKGFTSDASWLPVQSTSQLIEENFEGDMMNWLKDQPLYQQRNLEEQKMQERLIIELAKSLKRIAENAQPGENTDELLTNEIIKQLKQFPMDQEHKYDDKFHTNIAAQLLHYLKGLQIFQEITQSEPKPTGEKFTAIIEDWLNSIPINSRSSITETNLFAAIKEEFITRLKEIHQQHNSSKSYEQLLRKEIKEYLLLLPMDASKKRDQKFLNNKVEELLKSLLAVSRELDNEPKKGVLKDQILDIINDLSPESLVDADSKPGYKKPADMLYDNIKNWCKNLPIYLGDSPADIEKAETIKQNIASKLINKVGELNMNPQIFNDDLLYEDLLRDEIDDLLSSVPTNSELEKNLPELIKNLTAKVKEANHKAREELTGQVYKQQLKDTISETLHAPSKLSPEEQASFEILKDCVADAFINLHYVGNDEVLKNKFKKRITDEVTKFCNDFMKRYPDQPMNSEILNRDLYNALCNVTLPNEESMKSEVGQARIKDAINDWIKDLPLKQQSEAEQLQQSKMVSVIVKRLHDIEKEESFHPDTHNDERKQKEIVKWIKKLTLEPGNDDKIDKMAAKLVNNLKDTENSRRFSGLTMVSDVTESSNKNIETKNSTCRLQIPPCTLSQEDCAHLRRIRVRTPPVCKPQRNCMDVAISPCPVDSCTQTFEKIQRAVEENYKKKPTDSCGKNCEVSPKVIIREYDWDSTEDSKLNSKQQPNAQASQDQGIPICQDQSQSWNDVEPVSPSSTCKQNVGPSCPYERPPCTIFPPYTTPRSTFRNAGSSMSQRKIPCTSTPKRSAMRRKRDSFSPPCFNIDPSGNSTDVEEECSRNVRTRPRTLTDSVRFPDGDDFSNASYRSRTSNATSEESMGTGRDNQGIRCRCRDRPSMKIVCRKNQTCQMGGNGSVKGCSRCSVNHCPYPSYMYFRK